MGKRFGALLRQLRKENDLTLAGLAAKIEIKLQTLSLFELGKKLPTIEQVDKLIELFNNPLEIQEAYLSDAVSEAVNSLETSTGVKKDALINILTDLNHE